MNESKRHKNITFKVMLLLSVCLSIGCTSLTQDFHVKKLAKTDVDMVKDAYRVETKRLTDELLFKLYMRNPSELKKSGATLDQRRSQFRQSEFVSFSQSYMNDVRGIDAIRLALSEDYSADRVFTLMLGLSDMLSESYNNKDEFFIFDEIDQQRLYNSARNIEVLAWLLRTAKDERGQLLLLTNHSSDDLVNLSFERLLGKLIAHQDMLALIVSGKTQRAINYVAQGIVRITFIPL